MRPKTSRARTGARARVRGGLLAFHAALLLSLSIGTASADGLEYLERVTGNATAGETLPLVVAIHGLGDEPASFARLFDGFESCARFVFPRAPKKWIKGYTWYPLRDAPPGDEEAFVEGLLESTARVAALIERITTDRPTPSKVVVTGFSQGAILSYALAAKHGEAVALVVPVSGWLPPAVELAPAEAGSSRPRIVALHGEEDRRVPFARAADSVERLRAAGFEAELRGYAGVAHRISTEVRDDLWRLLDEALDGDCPADN